MNLKIEIFNINDLQTVVNLFNEAIKDTIYAEMTCEEFESKIINNANYKNEGSFVAKDGDKIIGFGNAIYQLKSDPKTSGGYIGLIFVDKAYRRMKVGTSLLQKMESYLKSEGRLFVRNYFGCPYNLKWYVPGYDKHEHAGSPAVPYNTAYYFLLLKNRYISNGQIDGFHVDLTKFELSDEIKKTIEENEKDGYKITYYDKNKHYGFDEMFDALGHEGFRATVNKIISRENHDPLIIVEKENEILGFTGPVKTEVSGRASLAGVAIHPKAQGRKLGKTMFCMLCKWSKDNGGKFMTLFTGSDNEARNIYLYAGLSIVQSFNIMRKDL